MAVPPSTAPGWTHDEDGWCHNDSEGISLGPTYTVEVSRGAAVIHTSIDHEEHGSPVRYSLEVDTDVWLTAQDFRVLLTAMTDEKD